MKKFLTLFAVLALAVNVFAVTATTVYYAVTNATVGNYTVKLNVRLDISGDDQWAQMTMTKLPVTYTLSGITYDVYKQDFNDRYDGVHAMQFQLYNESTWVSQEEPFSEWWTPAGYNNKIYVHSVGFKNPNTLFFQATPDDEESWSHAILWNEGVVKALDNNKIYQFLVVENGDNWFKTSSTAPITYSSTSLQLSTENSNNVKISTSTYEGSYVFTWDGEYVRVAYPSQTYSRPMSSGAWGTICLSHVVSAENVTAANMDFYSILGVDDKETPTKLYLKEESSLAAGKPYIFQATADNPSIAYGTTAAAAGNENGLYGTYMQTSINGGTENAKYYVITATGGVQRAASSCNVGANKAYIKLNDVPVYDPASLAPGVRVVEMNMDTNNATDIKSIEANESAVKFIENGKLFIQKNGVVYDMTGRVVR